MKATHLEQIEHDYERAKENQKLMEEGIMRQESVCCTIITFCIAYKEQGINKYGVC